VANLRQKLIGILLWSLLFAIIIPALGYAIDDAIFHVRKSAGWSPYGSVVVNHYTAIAQKNGKTQLIFDPPAPQDCVNSWVPHEGLQPCWYLRKHPEQRTDI